MGEVANMKVKELIEELKKFDGEMEIDFIYHHDKILFDKVEAIYELTEGVLTFEIT
jgi:hypothetical protein